MKFAAVGSALIALWQASGDWLIAPAVAESPEPLWMVLWGVALLGFAAAAREDARRRRVQKDNTAGSPAWDSADDCGAPCAPAMAVQSRRGVAH